MFEPGVDVVMVTYRTPQDAVGFVDSYRESRLPESSLWIANVDPTEEDVNAIDAALVNITGEHGLTTWAENVGYAHACNYAAAFGQREIVAFFNADTRLSPGVLSAVLEQFDLHPDWGVIGPRQYDDHGRITHGGIYGTNQEPSFDGRWKQYDTGQFNDIRDDAISVSGSAYFIRRELWDMLSDCDFYRIAAPEAEGAFLPTPHYYEETWCSYHARAHGWKVAYLGTVGMLHRWHQASPVGGYAERVMPMSLEMFRVACDLHGIAHE